MKYFFTGLAALFSIVAIAAENSKNNQTNKSWELNSTWQDGSAPAYTNIGSSGVDFNIFGYVSLGSSVSPKNMTFEGGNPTLKFTVADTLVIYGDMSFATDAMTLVVPAGGLLIVFGNLDINNKVDLSNAGNIIVTGTISKSGSQSSIDATGGTFYAAGYSNGAQGAQSAIGNGPPDPSLNAGSDLQANLPDLYTFVHGGGAGILPVELISFTAKADVNSVDLRWATASELNLDHFNLLRSTDGSKFEIIATITGNGTTDTPHSYSFTDQSPLSGISYYQLQSVDFDGITETFKVVSVKMEIEKTIFISPIPITESRVIFQLNFIPASDVIVTISSVTGIEFMRSRISGTDTTMDLDLKPGIYVVSVSSPEVNRAVRVVVK